MRDLFQKSKMQLTLPAAGIIIILTGLACSPESGELTNPASQGHLTEKANKLSVSKEMTDFIERYPTETDTVLTELSQLSHSERVALALDFLDSIPNQTQKADKELDFKFNNYLKIINAILPELHVFDYFHESEKNILSLKGIKLLTQYYLKNKSLYTNSVTALNLSELEEYLNSIDLIHQDYYLAILLQHSGSKHITPIFINNTDSNRQIIITDSNGVDTLVDKEHQFIEKILKSIGNSHLRKSDIYLFSAQRQYDYFSCPIISLTDVIETSQFNLFQFVHELITTSPNSIQKLETKLQDLSVYKVDYFPPRYMKVTQSLTQIRKYKKDYPFPTSEPSIEQIIDRNFKKGWVQTHGEWKFKEMNLGLKKTSFEYMIFLIHHLLTNPQS